MATGWQPRHYIRRNETTRVPRRHIVLDCEARDVSQSSGVAQKWLLAVAAFCESLPDGRWKIRYETYDTPEQLWGDIEAFCRPKKRTVLWAHNMGYDLRVSAGLSTLANAGWVCERIRLAQIGTFARWSKAGVSLTAVDSMSVWPCSLASLGRTIGMVKLPLPPDDTRSRWVARCRRDVDILRTAVCEYVDWLRNADMGCWQATGAGQAWAGFRHKHYTHPILVGDALGVAEHEQRALWTGRTEVWRWGVSHTARIYDYDWKNAYPNIARTVSVPTAQLSRVAKPTLAGLLQAATKYAVLARCTVTTEQPVVPTSHNGGILWPIGLFETTLWDPELRLLSECDAHVEIHEAWLYRKAPALKSWAEWALGEINDSSGAVPGWRKLLLKHWSRALVGRFALKYGVWADQGHAATFELEIRQAHDRDTGEYFRLMQIGHQVFEDRPPEPCSDYFPAVTGYIMSEQRAQLWRAMQMIGEANVLYVDTDGLLLTGRGARNAEALISNGHLEGLRRKRSYRGYEIGGPRQIILGGEPHISGLPRNAERVDQDRWVGEVWRGFERSLLLREPNQVTVHARTFRVRATDRRRTRQVDGRTSPVLVGAGTEFAPQMDLSGTEISPASPGPGSGRVRLV